MQTRLYAVRAPSDIEVSPGNLGAGAMIAFERRDQNKRTHVIFATACEGSYQQWGASRDVLGDNVQAVTLWAEGIAAVEALIGQEADD